MVKRDAVSKYRYSEQWSETSRLTRALAFDKCCYPLCKNKATCTHHVNYIKPWVPFENAFSLCPHHHGTCPESGFKLAVSEMSPDAAHHPNNWFVGVRKDRKDARNTDEYIARLKFGVSLILG